MQKTQLLTSLSRGESELRSWLGSSIGMWVEDDAVWDALARKSGPDRDKFLKENFTRLPIAVLIDVSSRTKLTAFLLGLCAFDPGNGNRE